MDPIYPPIGFYFQLEIPIDNGHAIASFQEVSGLRTEIDSGEINEEGSNRFKFRLPTVPKFSNLVLKRGLVEKKSPLVSWCQETVAGGLSSQISTKSLIVKLLNDQGTILKSWNFESAWPVKWEISDLNSMSSELAIETVEFSYSYFKES